VGPSLILSPLTRTSSYATGGGTHSCGQVLEAHQHTLFRYLKTRFSVDIWAKICLKMRIFLEEKSCKIIAASGDLPQKSMLVSSGWELRPQTPAFLLSLIDINLSKCVLAF